MKVGVDEGDDAEHCLPVSVNIKFHDFKSLGGDMWLKAALGYGVIDQGEMDQVGADVQ